MSESPGLLRHRRAGEHVARLSAEPWPPVGERTPGGPSRPTAADRCGVLQAHPPSGPRRTLPQVGAGRPAPSAIM